MTSSWSSDGSSGSFALPQRASPHKPDTRRAYLLPVAVFQHHGTSDGKAERLLSQAVDGTVVHVHGPMCPYAVGIVGPTVGIEPGAEKLRGRSILRG